MKTSELIGPTLDWAVAKCEGKDDDCEIHAGNVIYGRVTSGFVQYRPSTDWTQAGPIIEREKIVTSFDRNYDSNQPWRCAVSINPYNLFEGSTPIIAAMRCYVASKLGDEVEIPSELSN